MGPVKRAGRERAAAAATRRPARGRGARRELRVVATLSADVVALVTRVAPRRVGRLELRRRRRSSQARRPLRERPESRPPRPRPADAVLRWRPCGSTACTASRRAASAASTSARALTGLTALTAASWVLLIALVLALGDPGAGRAPDRLLVRGGPARPAGALGRPRHRSGRGRRSRSACSSSAPARSATRWPPRSPATREYRIDLVGFLDDGEPRRNGREGPAAAGDRRLGRPRRDRGRAAASTA